MVVGRRSLLGYSRHGLALELLLLDELLLNGIAHLDLLLKVVVVFTGSFRLVVSCSQHLWGLLLSPKHLGRQLLSSSYKRPLRADSGRSSDLWLRTGRLLHARFEIVHVTLTLVDLFYGRDLFLGL